MGSPFQRAFSGKSPLNKHGKLQRKLDKVNKGKMGSEGQGGIDYELKSQLQGQIKAAKAAHSREQDNSIVEEERDNSRADASMSRKQSPLDAIGAHSMKPSKYASHLASASEHKAPSDKERKGRKHISDKQPTNTPPKDGMSRKASPLNDGYIKQEEKMIKRNQKKGNQYQSASAGSRNQRVQNAIGSAQAANAITESKKTINLLKS